MSQYGTTCRHIRAVEASAGGQTALLARAQTDLALLRP